MKAAEHFSSLAFCRKLETSIFMSEKSEMSEIEKKPEMRQAVTSSDIDNTLSEDVGNLALGFAEISDISDIEKLVGRRKPMIAKAFPTFRHFRHIKQTHHKTFSTARARNTKRSARARSLS